MESSPQKTFHSTIFIHPACNCDPVVRLVDDISREFPYFIVKKVSLVTPKGRKQAFSVGVRTIPTLQLPNGTLLVTSKEITKENILSWIEESK